MTIGRTPRHLTWILAATVLMAVGCGEEDREGDTGIPNPAAVYCEEQGGVTSGPEPMCELPDGTVVDAWEYFREHHPEDGE